MDNPTRAGEGPAEQLLSHTVDILRLQEAVRARRRQIRALKCTAVATGVLTLVVYVTTAITWGTVDLGNVNRVAVPLAVVGVIALIAQISQERGRSAPERSPSPGPGGPGGVGGVGGGIGPVGGGPGERATKAPRRSVRELELDLEIAQERRMLRAAQLGVPVEQRQYAYKGSLSKELRRLRGGSRHYRRLHNVFQSTIIVGSLGTITATGLADTAGAMKWVTVGLSFLVGMSAGFTGYFKYRERSSALQQTADEIERHATAFDLGIGPYAHRESENLTKLTQEIESLRVEQRKREQQLDQPRP